MYVLAVANGSMPNSLAAMSVHEFQSRNRLVGPSDHIEVATPTVRLTSDAPASWDWRAHGVTTPVKSQLQCGNERAFGLSVERAFRQLLGIRLHRLHRVGFQD